jgi:hypothetical protein
MAIQPGGFKRYLKRSLLTDLVGGVLFPKIVAGFIAERIGA